MTVRELKRHLESFDDDAIVLVWNEHTPTGLSSPAEAIEDADVEYSLPGRQYAGGRTRRVTERAVKAVLIG